MSERILPGTLRAIGCAAICVALGVSVAFAQPARLSIVLSCDYKSVLPGFPVVVSVAITNTSNEPQAVPNRVEPDFRFVHYFIRRGNGERREFRPWAYKETEDGPEMLPPKQVKGGVARLFFGQDGWTLAEPGTYTIEAAIGEIRSNAVPVTVRAPESNAERGQVDLVMNEEVGYFLLFDGGDHLKDGIERLRRLQQQFPTAELTAHATLALGTNLSKDYADYAKNEVRKADLIESARLLDVSARSGAAQRSQFLRVTAASRLATVYEKLGDDIKARATRDMLQKEELSLKNRPSQLKVFEAMRDVP